MDKTKRTKTKKIFEPSERDIQVGIIAAIQLTGLGVLSTSQYKPTAGCDRGIPDLIVYHHTFQGFLIGLEVKKPNGFIRPEQKSLASQNAVHIVHSPEEAIVTIIKCLTNLETFTNPTGNELMVIDKLENIHRELTQNESHPSYNKTKNEAI